MYSTLTNFSNYLESNLKTNATLDYLTNVFEKKLKKYRKPRSRKPSRVQNHLIQVSQSNTPFDISVVGSSIEYKSMFLKVVRIGDESGFLIDTLMPREGNYRMDPETKVSITYSFGNMRYKFESTVIRYVKIQFPAYFIALPKSIKSNEKRMYYRMPTTSLKPLFLERKGDPIQERIIRNTKVVDFTSSGLCLELPPVDEMMKGKDFITETLKNLMIRLPDSTLTRPINASCCYLRPSPSSNGMLCGIRFDDIAPDDRSKLSSLYYQRQHEVQVA